MNDGETKLNISCNGKTCQVLDGTTIAQLLDQLEMRADQVAVEINEQLVPRDQHAQRELQDGDCLEVVTFVGGG